MNPHAPFVFRLHGMTRDDVRREIQLALHHEQLQSEEFATLLRAEVALTLPQAGANELSQVLCHPVVQKLLHTRGQRKIQLLPLQEIRRGLWDRFWLFPLTPEEHLALIDADVALTDPDGDLQKALSHEMVVEVAWDLLHPEAIDHAS